MERNNVKELLNGQVVYHAGFGTGRVVSIDGERVIVNFVKVGAKFFTHSTAEAELSFEPFEDNEDDDRPDVDELKEALREVLRAEGLIGAVDLGEKWDGGEMLLKPGKAGLQEKSVPIDSFFHKIVMVRNNLRVLEQNINSSEKLNDEDKVNLQQYITRCYGSLTTFNVLFADKKDWFVGAKKE
ncbi:MAG: hypothetical protein LUO89_10895 [Methanothrix sp.]|nr:hypothetical protein [Methanothrix sp.]